MNADTFRVDDRGVFWIGDRAVPWAKVEAADTGPPLTIHHRGALIKFENGYTLSLIWGTIAYGTNYDTASINEEPMLVEVGILHHEHGLIELPVYDNVAGYLTPADVLSIMDDVATWPTNGPVTWNDRNRKMFARMRGEE